MRIAALICAAAFFSNAAEYKLKLHDKTVSISSETAPATVIVFFSGVCPISNSYLERLNELFAAYSGRGIQFAFVNPNINESQSDVERHAKANQLVFPVYTDPGQALADRLGAQMTPEVFVFDRSGETRYHGRIDDAVNPARVRNHDLRDALDLILAGGHMADLKRETRAFGCTIKRRRT